MTRFSVLVLLLRLFNSHPHKEDDLLDNKLFFFHHFSTHILTRRMTLWEKLQGTVDAFQLTSSQGGWPCVRVLRAFLHLFNSHPHKEDDCVQLLNYILSNIFQLTSSQGGWPMGAHTGTVALDFSTHILTRRMTAILNKNTLSKTARIIPFEYNTLKIYIFSNSYLLFFWKNTPFSGANLPKDFCALIIRTKISKYP